MYYYMFSLIPFLCFFFLSFSLVFVWTVDDGSCSVDLVGFGGRPVQIPASQYFGAWAHLLTFTITSEGFLELSANGEVEGRWEATHGRTSEEIAWEDSPCGLPLGLLIRGYFIRTGVGRPVVLSCRFKVRFLRI